MNIPCTILVVILAVIAAVVLGIVLSQKAADKQAEKFETVGTTVGWQKSKIPFLGQVVIQYTKKGKLYQVGSNLMLKPKKLKIGSMNRWRVYIYRTAGKPPALMAKRIKAENKK